MATPIGNLEDLSPRAARILGEVDLVAAEDTRRTRGLLAHLGLHKPLVAYYDAVESRRGGELLAELERGANVALVSDAGTPLVSDPGYRLVALARRRGVRVVPVPGPSAVLALLSCAGLAPVPFTFAGFLPARPTARRRFLAALADRAETLVFFEAARRLPAALADSIEVLGDREAAIGRELTKRFEEVLRGRLSELVRRVEKGAPPKGEVVLAVAGLSKGAGRGASAEAAEALLGELLARGLSVPAAARRAAEELGLSRRELYRRALDLSPPGSRSGAGRESR